MLRGGGDYNDGDDDVSVDSGGNVAGTDISEFVDYVGDDDHFDVDGVGAGAREDVDDGGGIECDSRDGSGERRFLTSGLCACGNYGTSGVRANSPIVATLWLCR